MTDGSAVSSLYQLPGEKLIFDMQVPWDTFARLPCHGEYVGWEPGNVLHALIYAPF